MAVSYPVAGRVLDPRGAPVAGAEVKLQNAAGVSVRETTSDIQGNFILQAVPSGDYQLTAEAPSFVTVITNISVGSAQNRIELQFQQLVSVQQSITVVASAPSVLTPDPAQSVIIHDQVLDANP